MTKKRSAKSKQYTEKILAKLQSRDFNEVNEALQIIGEEKLRAALPALKTIALYDDDKGLQVEAIIAIKKIGGKGAKDILRFLKTTEHKEFIEKELDLFW